MCPEEVRRKDQRLGSQTRNCFTNPSQGKLSLVRGMAVRKGRAERHFKEKSVRTLKHEGSLHICFSSSLHKAWPRGCPQQILVE